WYPDPYGGGGHRWWDGTKWTEHVDSTPSRPSVQPVAPPQVGGGPVLHKVRWGIELHADPRAITWDGQTIELARAEFVGYTAVQNRMRGPLNIGSVHTSTDYHFEIGFFPVNEAPAIAFEETGMRANNPPDDWQFLVDLVKTYVEPRLLREFLAAVQAGQTVNVANVRVNRDGFVGGGVSRGWDAVAGVTFEKGNYFVHEKGGKRAVLRVPQQNQNVSLLPQVFDALKR
ncbi:DUF2510 domain-containing protein, partial [Actinomadura rubrisoli]